MRASQGCVIRLTASLLAVAALLAACRRDSDEGQDAPTSSPAPSAADSSAPAVTEAPTMSAAPEPQATEAAVISVEPGVYLESGTFGGEERTWRIYVPESLPAGQRVPLVIGMHGGTGWAEQFARNSRFDRQAEEGGFIAVYPDGTGAAQTWNGGRCCGYAVREGVDDVAFIAALLDRLAAAYPVDPARLYATGHSNGAIMAFRLACELPERIAAVAGVAGSLETGECAPSRPVSVLLIHGDADTNHPLEGGEGPDSIAGVPFTSVDETMRLLRPAMGCSEGTSVSTEGAVTTTTADGCPSGINVVLQVIAGQPHSWPGGTTNPGSPLDATAEVWEFLSAHGR